MSFTFDPASHGFDAPALRCEPYEPSIASSASSSQVSVFSDTGSSQSSVASSISDDFRNSQEDARDRVCAQAQLQHQARAAYLEQLKASSLQARQQQQQQPATYAHVTSIPAEQRQHPRRCSLARNQKPPPLVRQCERKTHFVDNLVDSAAQMVEVIWPLSVVPCRGEGSSGRGVLPLRTYIEETLRRSRTSYSTLQVALYYLVLIKPHVPKADFTMAQDGDCAAVRALMCGRRMFLAALILASKYLQDRNYSAKAWSKMSGLKVCEINSNERTFLGKVNWKLHIPELIFKRWTDVVLRFTPTQPPATAGQSLVPGTCVPFSWKQVIPLLTPDLDKLPTTNAEAAPSIQCPANYGFGSAVISTPPKNGLSAMSLESSSQESTPTPATVVPRFLQCKSDTSGPPTPALVRLGPLPTPQLTPSSVASNTPAASACGFRRPSICSAMAFAQQASFNRCATDGYPMGVPDMNKYRSRRPSITSMSSGSSPESMMSDHSRSSRASSISSVSTTSSAMAPQRACLARQATCRNARLPCPANLNANTIREREQHHHLQQEKEREGHSAAKPIMIVDSDVEMVSSPDFASFTISDKALHAPHRHSKSAAHSNLHSHQAAPAPCTNGSERAGGCGGGRKRARTRGGGRRSDLQEECRLLFEEELEAMVEVEDDEDVASPSPASEYASLMLTRDASAPFHPAAARTAFAGQGQETATSVNVKAPQPPAALSLLSRRESAYSRLPVQKNEGKKRACCSSSAASSSFQ